jgi:hypothetical protein
MKELKELMATMPARAAAKLAGDNVAALYGI